MPDSQCPTPKMAAPIRARAPWELEIGRWELSLFLDHRGAAAARRHHDEHDEQHEGDYADGNPDRALPPDAAAAGMRVDVDIQLALRGLTLRERQHRHRDVAEAEHRNQRERRDKKPH